jgi:DNA-binding response OmpR family regulator
MRVLVVEDNVNLARGLRHNLELEGYEVEMAYDGTAGLALARSERADLKILDLMIPRPDGYQLLRTLREEAIRTPVIVLTARGDEADKLRGFRLGADDYVTKPFSLRELAARVRAVLRRRASPKGTGLSIYRGKHLVADFDAVMVTVSGQPVRLTRREFELLRCLVENRNRVLSRDRLLERVWGYERFVETRSVDVHVGRLRSKLGLAGPQIETVVGLGYRFVE